MRNRALDGIRGILALIVMMSHIVPDTLSGALARSSVMVFFVLSGMVLAPTYDRYGAFLARRFVRLMPMYLLCVGTAYLLADQPNWSTFFWFPYPNLPAWSLVYEFAAMLAFPLILWLRGRIALAAGICLALVLIGTPISQLTGVTLAAFVIGVSLTGKRVEGRLLESPIAQYLGRISYPLYLSHYVVLIYVPASLPVKLVIIFAIAHVLTVTVERWSIEASRKVTGLRLAAHT